MAPLNSKQILEEQDNPDPTSVTSLHLSHRALTQISCLVDFANLEKLDLSYNNLSTLEGLRSCINLKWLSVAHNMLQSLKGIEGLPKLTVLNAGHNKLTSVDEVRSVTSLRALILNDNDIASICEIDQLHSLNTLVLSQNPIHDIGKALMKARSIAKLSLSHCRFQTIGSSLMFCVGLREVRLAHNDIKTVPFELAHNVKIQTLDLGNNLITNWSDLKVLSCLHDLKNLNLKGNPIAEKDKLAKKVRKLLPNLKIFNTQPIESGNIVKKNSFSHNTHSPDNAIDYTVEKDIKRRTKNIEESNGEELHNMEIHSPVNAKIGKEAKRKKPESIKKNKFEVIHGVVNNSPNHAIEKMEVEKKGSKKLEKTRSEGMDYRDDHSHGNATDTKMEKEVKRRKSKNKGKPKFLGIDDDGETPFVDLIFSENTEMSITNSYGENRNTEAVRDTKSQSGIVSILGRKMKKAKVPELEYLLQTSEIGSGGPSAWDV